MNFTKTGSYTYNGETKEYHYSPTATISEQIAFVEMVSNGVFIGDSYLPLLKNPVFDYWIIATFTDIDMSNFTDIDAFDKFNKETGVITHIEEELDFGLLDSLTESVDANIEHKKSITHDNISTAVVDLIKTVKNKLETFGEGLDSNAVMDFIQKFSEAGIDGESIVNAYLNSDQYKENVAKVVDAKNADIRDLKQKLNDVTAKNVVTDAHIKDMGTRSENIISIKDE